MSCATATKSNDLACGTVFPGVSKSIAVTDAVAFAVEVDSSSLRLPWWVPATPRHAAEVEPSRRHEIDVPVVIGATVDGRVEWAGDGAAPELTSLELRNLTTGAVRPISVYGDGSFYETGIQPGAYELTTILADSAPAPTSVGR